jgi:hypothetical protein
VLSGNETLLANQITEFDGLRIDIRQLARVLRAGTQEWGSQDPDVMRNLQDCLQSATDVVSSASTIMGDTTVYGGSEFEMPIGEEQRNRIGDWIEDNSKTIAEDGPRDRAETSVDMLVDVPTRDHEATTAAAASALSPSLDGEIEARLINHWQSKAQSSFSAREYNEAETCIRKVIERSRLVHGRDFEGRHEAWTMLVLALVEQRKWDETLLSLEEISERRDEVIEKVVANCFKQAPVEETFIRRLWDLSSHSRWQAEVELMRAMAAACLQKKDYTAAEDWCRQAIHSIKQRVGMNNKLFDESVTLMARIQEIKGDKTEAEAYRSMLQVQAGMTSLSRLLLTRRISAGPGL